jgi:hypothetical protein
MLSANGAHVDTTAHSSLPCLRDTAYVESVNADLIGKREAGDPKDIWPDFPSEGVCLRFKNIEVKGDFDMYL